MSQRTRIAALERRLVPANAMPTLIRITGSLPDADPAHDGGHQELKREPDETLRTFEARVLAAARAVGRKSWLWEDCRTDRARLGASRAISSTREFRHDQMRAFLAALWVVEETPTACSLDEAPAPPLLPDRLLANVVSRRCTLCVLHRS